MISQYRQFSAARPADQDPLTYATTTVDGTEYELFAMELPQHPGLYFAAVFERPEHYPRFQGRTLHPTPAAALTEAFAAAFDQAAS
jgi:hypothetical protein